jgi:hypothetical protein
MDTKSTPPEHGNGQHKPNNEAAEEHANHISNNPPAPDKNNIIQARFIPFLPAAFSRLLEVAISWILWILGGDFQGAGHKFIGYLFDWLAITVFLLLAADIVFSVWKNRKAIIVLFICSSLLIAAVYVMLFVQTLPPNPTKSKPTETNVVEWQPPEIPDSIKIAHLNFGDARWPIDIDKLRAGQPFAPPGIGPNPIRIYLKDNRLYVHSDSGPNGSEIVSTPDFMDNYIQQGWDRNFTNNVFEVVNRDTVPTLQVIYNHPNEITVNGIFLITRANNLPPIPTNNPVAIFLHGKPMAVMAVFGKNVSLIPVNPDEVAATVLQFTDKVLFKYPYWKFQGVFTDKPIEHPTTMVPPPDYIEGTQITHNQPVEGYELLPPLVVSNVIQKLRLSQLGSGVVLIHAFDPDESSYELSTQLEQIFFVGGYLGVDGKPPVGAPEVPGVSCFLYGGVEANPGLFQALALIETATGSHPGFRMMVGDEDPWFTNRVVVILIRHK